MLSYQHGYHAGNFADVVKHFILVRLLTYLTQKDKPLFYLETHAGKGLYPLQDKQALKTNEFLQGIQLLWDKKKEAPASFAPYLTILQSLNPQKLTTYPGSPYLAIQLLRDIDRLYCCELHPQEFEGLQQLPRSGKKVHYSHSDGLHSLKSLLPPPEKRGLVFIDPSFEMKEDYKKIPQLIKEAYSHFSQGVFCLWYPIVDPYLNNQLKRGMESIEADKKLHLELHLTLAKQPGMTGCGLWIINPPHVLAQETEVGLSFLRDLFSPKMGSYYTSS